MTRDQLEGAATAEPLSRLLARSEAASREVEDVLARIDELVARLEGEDGSAPEQLAEVEGSDRPAEVPEVHVVVEAQSPPTAAAVAAGPASQAPRSDPWRYLTERLLLAHDTANGDGSVDHDVVILQEAARRRLSDER